MNAKPKSKFTFAGVTVRENGAFPLWASEHGTFLARMSLLFLSLAEREEMLAFSVYGRDDCIADYWLAYEEDAP